VTWRRDARMRSPAAGMLSGKRFGRNRRDLFAAAGLSPTPGSDQAALACRHAIQPFDSCSSNSRIFHSTPITCARVRKSIADRKTSRRRGSREGQLRCVFGATSGFAYHARRQARPSHASGRRTGLPAVSAFPRQCGGAVSSSMHRVLVDIASPAGRRTFMIPAFPRSVAPSCGQRT